MADFSLAREAYADLEDIDRYTLETWGEEQRIAYVTGLFDQFETIAGNPGLGRPRHDIDEGVFSLPYERHVIFYEVYVGRCHVLHAARDVHQAFP